MKGASLSSITIDRLPRKVSSIRCKCGIEIAMIPDYTQMGRDIERHAQEHKIKEDNPDKAEAVFASIQDHLIAQVLEKATEALNDKTFCLVAR